MTSNQIDLQAVALKIVLDGFAECDYFIGEKVISDVMVMWPSRVVNCPPTFMTDIDKPFFSRAAGENQQLREVIFKWSKRYWDYFTKMKDENVESFTDPKLTMNSSNTLGHISALRNKIFKTLEHLNLDDCVELMAILTVEWARRFNTKNFLQFVQQNNPTHLDGLKNDSNIVTEALYYMDIYFQLA